VIQLSELVLVPQLSQDIEKRVIVPFRMSQFVRFGQVELGEMIAAEVVGEVGGGEAELVVVDVHEIVLSSRR
jgi:hypothetical protein